jgi:hypothetical protein
MHKDSRFILDVMDGDVIADTKPGTWKLDYTSTLPDGSAIERSQKTIEVNEEKSVVHKIFRYIVTGKNGSCFEKEFDAYMKITPNEKLHQIIREAGLEIEHVWRDYLFQTSSSTNKMIYCLKTHDITEN